jgi:hypothetical protein
MNTVTGMRVRVVGNGWQDIATIENVGPRYFSLYRYYKSIFDRVSGFELMDSGCGIRRVVNY